jgi:competence protein ComEC
MHQPAVFAFAGLAAGIILSQELSLVSADVVRTLLIASLGIAVTSVFIPQRFVIVRLMLLFFCAMMIGTSLHQSDELVYQHSVLRRAAAAFSDEVEIRGRVVSSPSLKQRSMMIIVETDTLIARGEHIVCNDRLAVYIPYDNSSDAQTRPSVGASIRAYGVLEECSGIRNPYELPYRIALRRQHNVAAILTLRSVYDLRLDTSHTDRTLVEEVIHRSYTVRRWIDERLRRVIDDSIAAGFASAVLIGERNDLLPTTWQDFQKAGLSHIIVVSGFNLAVVTVFFYYLLRLFGIRHRLIRSLVTMCIVIIYALVAGSEPSIFRAGIAVLIFLAARNLERRFDIVNALATAAAVTLIVNPNDLFNIGFQLSYTAVLSLIIITPQLEKFVQRRPTPPPTDPTIAAKTGKLFVSYFLTSCAVFLGTLPILLINFHMTSLIGLLLNIIVVPLSSFITVSSLLFVIFSYLPSIGTVFGEVLSAAVHIIIWLTGISIKLPFAYIRTPHFGLGSIIGYYALLAYLLSASKRKLLIGRIGVVLIIAADIALLGIPVASGILKENTEAVVFFDVGQGDAALLRMTDGKAYMIDFGGGTSWTNTAADRSIIPFLAAEQLLTIHGGFISHMHADHFEGLLSLIRERIVDTIYTSGERSQIHAAYELESLVRSGHIPVRRLSRGMIIPFSDETKAYILSPSADEMINDNGSAVENHHSLAMKIVSPNGSILFLGDIDAETERRLVLRYGSFLASDIVKIAHHGSATSSDQMLIDTVNARYAVISAGRKNRHRHPNALVLRRWHKSGARLVSTTSGAVIFRSSPNGFTLADWR